MAPTLRVLSESYIKQKLSRSNPLLCPPTNRAYWHTSPKLQINSSDTRVLSDIALKKRNVLYHPTHLPSAPSSHSGRSQKMLSHTTLPPFIPAHVLTSPKMQTDSSDAAMPPASVCCSTWSRSTCDTARAIGRLVLIGLVDRQAACLGVLQHLVQEHL